MKLMQALHYANMNAWAADEAAMSRPPRARGMLSP